MVAAVRTPYGRFGPTSRSHRGTPSAAMTSPAIVKYAEPSVTGNMARAGTTVALFQTASWAAAARHVARFMVPKVTTERPARRRDPEVLTRLA
jgi:hypothetical protein